jgi:hypothetical protein
MWNRNLQLTRNLKEAITMNQENQRDLHTESAATPLEKLDRSLSELFGTPPMEVETNLPANVVENSVKVVAEDVDLDSTASDTTKLESDAEFARANMHTLISAGKDAIEYALQLAKDSDNPRAFEVVFAGLKNLSDMNSQLLDIHQKKNAAKGMKAGGRARAERSATAERIASSRS